MVDAGVTGVLSKLGEVASAEATALFRVDDQIRELRRRLVYLQALVRGADQQRRVRASELLLLWAHETREVAFEVEDAVDEFHLKVEVEAKWGHSWYNSALKLLNGFRFPMQIVARHRLSREITKINGRIEEISQIKETYKIESSPSEIWSASSIDAADADWDVEAEDAIEFRETEFAALREYILDKQSKIKHRAVISIVGDSGIGKTTLARKLYNDRGVRDHFKVHAWISLPPHIRFEKYLEMMYEQIRRQVPAKDLHVDPGGTCSDKQLQQLLKEQLQQLLNEYSYLVVLDGLVDISDWNSLVDLLPDDNRKSRILLTTQLNEKEIKPSVKKIPPIVLEPLHNIGTNIEKLFNGRAFGFGANDIHADSDSSIGQSTYRQRALKIIPPIVLEPLHNIGTNIEKLFNGRAFGFGANDIHADSDSSVGQSTYRQRALKISTGLPLAIVVLSGLLRTKMSDAERDEVFQQLERSEGQPKPIRCLWTLAFEDLPHHLKSCFLYFATASDNILLDPDRLLRLWIAEGFIAPKKGKTLEEVGLGYLKELISRGLVQVVKNARGGIKYVAVHSLLHAFAESEAQESCFFEMHHNANIQNPHSVRRLALHNYVDSYVDIPNHLPKLRSLFCAFLEEDQQVGEGGGSSCWANAAEWFLRACVSSESPAGLTKLHKLSFIRGSRFLRVIDLNGLLLERVPDEIGSIIHLRYLGIRGCKLKALPSSISKLDNLQTLDVRETKVQNVTDEFWEIQGLRHVLADGLRLSKCRSAHLKHLQTLVGAVPASTWHASCPLNSMIYLRSLAMSLISKEHVSALPKALQKMKFLVSLNLKVTDSESHLSHLPSCVFTHSSFRRLEVLVLHGMLDFNDSWQERPERQDPFSLPNLGMLSMSKSALKQDFIDKVATLPNLTEMELLDDSYSGVFLNFHEEGFQSLTKLKLVNLPQLKSVVLPKLNRTVLTSFGCPVMTNVENHQPVPPDDDRELGMILARRRNYR